MIIKLNTITFLNKNPESINNDKRLSIMLRDIANVVQELQITKDEVLVPIIEIVNHYKPNNELRKRKIKEIIDQYKDTHIICTTAYISQDEFSPEEYNFEYDGKRTLIHKSGDESKNVSIDTILNRECELLEDQKLGFVNINSYINYNYNVAYIYPNEYGKKIIEHWCAINKKED